MERQPNGSWKNWLLLALSSAVGAMFYFLAQQVIANTVSIERMKETNSQQERRISRLEDILERNAP